MLDAAIASNIAEQLGERKSAHLEAQVERYRRQIDALTEQNAGFTANITANLRRMAEQRDMLNRAQDASGDRSYASHLVEEWSELEKHDRLTNAKMDGSVLTLWTTDDIRLHREDSEETRWLGAFRIVLDLEAGGFQLHNLDTRRGGRDHPHVVNGNPCFGGDHRTFAQLLAEGHLNVLYEMLLQYLEKLNLADEYGAYGAYWFEQPDVRPEGAPAPPRVETVPDFAERYGDGAEFTCVRGPSTEMDREGRRGRVVGGIVDGAVEIEWLDTGRDEQRSTGLYVRAVEAEVVEVAA